MLLHTVTLSWNAADTVAQDALLPQTNDRLTNGKTALAHWIGEGGSRLAKSKELAPLRPATKIESLHVAGRNGVLPKRYVQLPAALTNSLPATYEKTMSNIHSQPTFDSSSPGRLFAMDIDQLSLTRHCILLHGCLQPSRRLKHLRGNKRRRYFPFN